MRFSKIAYLLLSGLLVLAFPQSQAVEQSSKSRPQQSLMTRLREFIGTQPRSVSVGGTRSAVGETVCLLSPGPIRQLPLDWLTRMKKRIFKTSIRQRSEILVVDASPDLVLGSKLNEIEIRSGNKVVWSQMGTSKKAIDGHIAWPIEPIKPRQRLHLGLRPRGTAGGDWAHITLVGAPRSAMQAYHKTLEASSGSPSARLLAVGSAARSQDQSKALALLWAPLPSSTDKTINELRADALASCS